MSEDELQEVEEQNTKKYITVTLDKVADAELIGKYSRMQKIGGFSGRDVLEAGLKALVGSEQYQNAIKELQSELGE